MEKFYLILSIVLSAFSILGSIGIVFTTIANLKARITVLEKRIKVDEENIKDLYNSRLEHSERIAFLEGKKKRGK